MYFYNQIAKKTTYQEVVAILVIMEDVFLHPIPKINPNTLVEVAILVIMEDVFLQFFFFFFIIFIYVAILVIMEDVFLLEGVFENLISR